MEDMSLTDKLEETKRIYDANMKAAQEAADTAAKEFLRMAHEAKVHERYARMQYHQLMKTIKGI